MFGVAFLTAMVMTCQPSPEAETIADLRITHVVVELDSEESADHLKRLHEKIERAYSSESNKEILAYAQEHGVVKHHSKWNSTIKGFGEITSRERAVEGITHVEGTIVPLEGGRYEVDLIVKVFERRPDGVSGCGFVGVKSKMDNDSPVYVALRPTRHDAVQEDGTIRRIYLQSVTVVELCTDAVPAKRPR
jgi:hypothetical protein